MRTLFKAIANVNPNNGGLLIPCRCLVSSKQIRSLHKPNCMVLTPNKHWIKSYGPYIPVHWFSVLWVVTLVCWRVCATSQLYGQNSKWCWISMSLCWLSLCTFQTMVTECEQNMLKLEQRQRREKMSEEAASWSDVCRKKEYCLFNLTNPNCFLCSTSMCSYFWGRGVQAMANAVTLGMQLHSAYGADLRQKCKSVFSCNCMQLCVQISWTVLKFLPIIFTIPIHCYLQPLVM